MSLYTSTHERTTGHLGRRGSRVGTIVLVAPFARERAAGEPGGANTVPPDRMPDRYTTGFRRVATARISLKRTPRFRLAPCGSQNGARLGYRVILRGEYTLSAL